jgi:VWFA-related protein
MVVGCGISGVGRFMKIALHILLFAIAATVWAQEVPTFKTSVNVVTLLATVRDHDGRIINNLTPDDFVLLEDGVPQKIRYFLRESDLPLTIGLLVDTSRSQTRVLDEQRGASYKFLDQVLREGKDQAFIVHFDTRVEILQELTSSRVKLASALQELSTPGEVGTLLYSAVKDSARGPMQNQTARKAMILLTDGVAYRDPTSIDTAIEFAQRADTIIYSIRFSDPVPIGPLRAAFVASMKEHGKLELERMARETGGVSYGVTKSQPIEATYSQIEQTLRNQYSIGYTPNRSSPDGKFHKLKLTTRDRHLIVITRDGFYAK